MDIARLQERLEGIAASGVLLTVQRADELRESLGHEELGLLHIQLTLLRRNRKLYARIAGSDDPAMEADSVLKRLEKGETGDAVEADELALGLEDTAAMRESDRVFEQDLVRWLLGRLGLPVAQQPGEPAPSAAGPAPGTQPSGPSAKQGGLRTESLAAFGRDLVAEAETGRFDAIVGREQELTLLMETLCRTTKRNPMLVGPAGSGKTAIAELFARKLARGEVPEMLEGSRLFMIQLSSIVASSTLVGQVEEKVKKLVEEARQPGVILFIDEFHMAVGAGGARGTSDISNMLKPALSRGEVSVIGATTEEEYRRYIEPDGALARRFQAVQVTELDRATTLVVLRAVAQRLESLRGVVVPEPLLEWFVEFADRYIPQRHFPDKAVDLLEQSVAHAVTAGHASLTPDDAAAVARRLVSMPLDLTAGLEDLGEELGRRSLLRQEDARRIVTRLSVTMRALDFDDVRPNLVALFTGDALPALDRVAETIADMLFGSEMKVVRIDLGGMQDPHDTNQLLGAGPGYIGYDAALPLHRVKRMPFSVLVFENVHAAHPAVRNLLAQAFEVGHFTMNDGTTVDVSDAAVLLGAKNAAQIKVESRPIGFGARERKEEPSSTESRKELQRILGRELMLQVDFVVEALLADEGARTRWLTSSFLPELSDRFRQVGLDVRWDETIAAWLADRAGQPAQWRKIVDREITPLLIPWIERGAMENGTNVLVALRDGQVKVSERTS